MTRTPQAYKCNLCDGRARPARGLPDQPSRSRKAVPRLDRRLRASRTSRVSQGECLMATRHLNHRWRYRGAQCIGLSGKKDGRLGINTVFAERPYFRMVPALYLGATMRESTSHGHTASRAPGGGRMHAWGSRPCSGGGRLGSTPPSSADPDDGRRRLRTMPDRHGARARAAAHLARRDRRPLVLTLDEAGPVSRGRPGHQRCHGGAGLHLLHPPERHPLARSRPHHRRVARASAAHGGQGLRAIVARGWKTTA